MSYILKALKKSQQERELGKVPSLSAGPGTPVGTGPASRISPWSLGALFLALAAMSIALYGTFGQRFFQPREAPPAARMPAISQNPAAASMPPPADMQTPAATPTPHRPPARTTLEAQARDRSGERAARAENRVVQRPAAQRRKTAVSLAPSAMPQPRQNPSPDSTQPSTPQPHADVSNGLDRLDRRNYPEFLRQEAEQLRKRLTALQPGPAAAAHGRRDGAMAVAPRTTPGKHPQAVAAPAPVTPGKPSARPRLPLETELPVEIARAIPHRQIIAHAYAKDAARRFIIMNSVKLREGEKSREGLVLEEILPNGMIFRYKSHRFFQPR